MIRPLPLESTEIDPHEDTHRTMALDAVPASRNFSGSTTVTICDSRSFLASLVSRPLRIRLLAPMLVSSTRRNQRSSSTRA